MKNILKPEMKERVVTFLNRGEVDFLDKLGKDALFSTGLKLSRTKLIAWMIDFMQNLKFNVEGVRSEKDFAHRILEVLGKNLKGVSSTCHGR